MLAGTDRRHGVDLGRQRADPASTSTRGRTCSRRAASTATDEKATRYRQQFIDRDWLDVVTAAPPADDLTALVVRHRIDADTYATVLGQFITSSPGALSIAYSRTPWERAGWTEKSWS